MARFCACMSWFLFCLTPTLITVAALAVPENAFAVYAECQRWCGTQYSDPTDVENCSMYCSMCGCDSLPEQDRPNCLTSCGFTAGIKCPGNSCDNTKNANTRCTLKEYPMYCSQGAYTCSQDQLKCSTCGCTGNMDTMKCWCK